MSAPGYHSMSPDRAPMSPPQGGNMIPAAWVDEMMAGLDRRPPDGYRELRLRDRRWLWLRHKTIMVPYWYPIRRFP